MKNKKPGKGLTKIKDARRNKTNTSVPVHARRETNF